MANSGIDEVIYSCAGESVDNGFADIFGECWVVVSDYVIVVEP